MNVLRVQTSLENITINKYPSVEELENVSNCYRIRNVFDQWYINILNVH